MIKHPFLIILIGIISACGGDPLADESGFSVFLLYNDSNFTIKVACELNGYSQCDDESVPPGDVHEIGTYGEIGSMPGPAPEYIFDRLTVLYDSGDGNFISAYEIAADEWAVEQESPNNITYSFSVTDSLLITD